MSDILLLVNDDEFRPLLLEYLQGHKVTVVTSPGEVRVLLNTFRYALTIITNFGVGPADAVSAIPQCSDYPVLFLTGYINAGIEAVCRGKNIPWLAGAVEEDALRRELSLALEDLGFHPSGGTAQL